VLLRGEVRVLITGENNCNYEACYLLKLYKHRLRCMSSTGIDIF
jgi:hypothetical protein